MSARPPVRFSPTPAAVLAGFLAGVVVVAVLSACGPDRPGVRPTLGEPRPEGLMVYQPPPGSRFDYVVYVPNAQPRLAERSDRLAWVRTRMATRCLVADARDLYAHEGGGAWPDGRTKVYYAVGVTCVPRVLPPARELAPIP